MQRSVAAASSAFGGGFQRAGQPAQGGQAEVACRAPQVMRLAAQGFPLAGLGGFGDRVRRAVHAVLNKFSAISGSSRAVVMDSCKSCSSATSNTGVCAAAASALVGLGSEGWWGGTVPTA